MKELNLEENKDLQIEEIALNEKVAEVTVEAEEAIAEVAEVAVEAKDATVEVTTVETDIISEEDEQNVSALTREELLDRLVGFYENQQLSTSKNLVALLRVKFKDLTTELRKTSLEEFVEEGGNKIDFRFEDTLNTKFSEISNKIREYHIKLREENEKLLADNLLKKKEILEQLKQLIDIDQPLKKTYDEFNKLTEDWKGIKPIARAYANELWQNYHFLVEKFFEKVRINNELRELDFKKNLEQKILLCEKVEELLKEEIINKAAKELNELHERWKEIGAVANDKREELWSRFKASSDTIIQKRNDHYDNMQVVMEQNLLAKKALCEKIENIVIVECSTIKQWMDQGDKVDELMKLWKAIGRAISKENDAIWARFKGSIDTFYGAKKDFFQTLRDEQLNNYNFKVEICVKAENIANNRTDWKAATNDLLKLQEDWKKIGSVSNKVSDKIWKRFRAACDLFFNTKGEQITAMKGKEGENLEIKKGLIQEVKALECENRDALLVAIKDIQRRWTEVGFVPMAEKDKIYEEFRAAIDEKFAIFGSVRKGIVGRVADINTEEDAALLSDRDVYQLNQKITEMRADINLWENNIEFFSSSKNANVLKLEFEKKITLAKQDLALLEAKLKLIKKPASQR